MDINAAPMTPEQASIYTDLHGLEKLKELSRTDQKAALKAAAQQFEALFLQMMLRQAAKVNYDDEGLVTSERTRFFQQWYYDQLAQDIATKGSIGLADQLVEQLSPRHPTMTVEEYEQKSRTGQLPDTATALKLRRP